MPQILRTVLRKLARRPGFTTVAVRTLARSLDEIGMMNTDTLNLTGLERPERVQPILGPGMWDEDGLPEAEPVVVVSHALWRTRLGDDRDVVGRTREIGVRMALGARTVDVARMVVSQAVAVAASWLPARRAAATDPLEALRHE